MALPLATLAPISPVGVAPSGTDARDTVPPHGTARVHRGGPWAQTQGTGTRFFHRFLFPLLLLSVPSHLFKALSDGESRK